jgi:hypothetical protein
MAARARCKRGPEALQLVWALNRRKPPWASVDLRTSDFQSENCRRTGREARTYMPPADAPMTFEGDRAGD